MATLTWGDATTAGGFFTGDQHKIDVSKLLATLFVKEVAFLQKVPIKGQAQDIEHRWYEAILTPPTFTASYTAATNTLNITDPATTEEVQKRLRRYAIVKADGTDLWLQFGSDPVTGNNTVTVYSGTNADVASTTWSVVSLPHADEDDPTNSMVGFDTYRKNYVQRFERSVDITATAKGIELHPGTDGKQWIKDQIKREMMRIKIEMDHAAILGVASSSANAARRTMAGFIQQVRDPDLDGTNEDTTVVDAGGVTITTELINTLAKTVFDQGGLDSQAKPYLVCNAVQVNKLSKLNEAIRRADISDRTVGYSVEAFDTSLGVRIPILLDRWVPNDTILLVDYSRIRWTPLRYNQLTMEKLARVNMLVDRWQISGAYTLVVEHAEHAHGLIRNLSTS